MWLLPHFLGKGPQHRREKTTEAGHFVFIKKNQGFKSLQPSWLADSSVFFVCTSAVNIRKTSKNSHNSHHLLNIFVCVPSAVPSTLHGLSHLTFATNWWGLYLYQSLFPDKETSNLERLNHKTKQLITKVEIQIQIWFDFKGCFPPQLQIWVTYRKFKIHQYLNLKLTNPIQLIWDENWASFCFF